MTRDYVIVGVILLGLGAMQIYLRYGGRGKAVRAESARRAGTVPKDASGLWRLWTSVLGFVSMAVGLALLILGLLGA